MNKCLTCKRDFLYDRKKGHRINTCNNCLIAKNRKAKKEKSVNYKGGKCSACGYNKSFRALGFHHLDKTLKEFPINRYLTYSWSKLVKELDKCILLCSNCHMEEEERLENCKNVAR